MTGKAIAIIGILALLSICIGCSNGTPSSLTTPVEAMHSAGSIQSHQLWGLWQFVADPGAATLDAIPLRSSEMHVNVLPFLEPPPKLNLTLESLEFNGDIIEVVIGLRHPFLGLTKFTGFDVCGIFITNGAISGFTDPDLVMAGDGDTRLLNPDGFARWWNPAEFPVNEGTMFSYNDGLLGTPHSSGNFNSTLNGYKYFCDALGPDDAIESIPVNSRGQFSPGQMNTRHYTIKMEAGLIFNYAIDACWVFPQGDPPWNAPDDFPENANRPEAYRISVAEIHNSLYWSDTETGGELHLAIDVYDWFNADLNNVRVESPGNFTVAESSTPIGGGDGYSTYQVDITETTLTSDDDIELLITIESDALDYGGLLPDKTVSAYFTHTSEVFTEEPSLEYNFQISTVRNSTGGISRIVLEWDKISGYPQTNIYFKSAYEPGAEWKNKLPFPYGGTSIEWVEGFLTYEGYMFYIAGWNGTSEYTPSQTAFILMEDAEETVDTFSVWEDDWRQLGDYYIRWGPLGDGPHSPPPANGTYSWDEAAIENFDTHPGDFWTGFWMLLCSPVLPVESEQTTAYVEYMSRIQTYDWSPPESSGYPGGKVGMCDAVDHSNFYPSDDYKEGFEYPVDDVPGLYLWGQFPNCSQPEAGVAGDYSYWQFTSYYLNDVLTLTNPRAGFAFGAVNNAGGYGWNVDDIAIIIY